MKKNKDCIIGLACIFLLFVVFFTYKYVISEKKQYDLYDDFTRGNQVMTLSFNKNFDIQYAMIRYIQSSDFSKKETRGSLIYDFSTYNIVPVLNYLNRSSENDGLVTSFGKYMDFIANYNAASMQLRENIFPKTLSDKYYIFDDSIYTYKTKKKILTKDFFKKTFDEFLNNCGGKKLEDEFLNDLYSENAIKKNYTYYELENDIKNNYDDFYDNYENIIIATISKILDDYVDYLNNKIFIFEDGYLPSFKVNESYFDVEEIEINYEFVVLNRIYDPVSKYYTHSFQLDLNDVWEQIKKLGYPKLYC